MIFSSAKAGANIVSMITFRLLTIFMHAIDLSSLEIRDKHELELDFKRYWEEFRSSSLEKVLACLYMAIFGLLFCVLVLQAESFVNDFFIIHAGERSGLEFDCRCFL